MRPRPTVLIISLIFLCTCVLSAPVSAAWTWTDAMINNSFDAGRWNSIALDNAGNPAISYYVHYGALGGGVNYAWYDGAAWNDQCVIVGGDNVVLPGQYTSLAFNGGKPSISWYYSDRGDLYYSNKNGAWTNTGIDTVAVFPGVGSYTSLAFDNTGNPAISYYDVTNQNLNFTWYNGAAWIMRDGPPDAGGDVGKFTSLAFDNTNVPCISYYDVTNQNLNFTWYNGADWIKPAAAIDSVGDVGQNTSLAFDNAGNPGISYYDATNGALKYAHRTAGVWTVVTVDNDGDVGKFTSLAFDNSGNPGVSYYDVTNSALKYAWNDGTGWQTTTINATGDLGQYSSITFNGANPCISYYDWTNSALWYVTGTWANPGGGNPGGGTTDNSGGGSLSVGDACAGYASNVEITGQYVNITFHCDNCAISMLSLLFNTNVSEVLATTTKKDRLPSSVPLVNGSGYEYIDIEMFKIDLSWIDEGIIYFTIPMSWITQHGLDPENIVMLHYNSDTGEWEIMDTEIISTSGGWVSFRAYTDSFSLFAIGGDKSYHTINSLGGSEIKETLLPTTVATTTKTPVPTSTGIPDNSSGNFPLTYLWIAILILISVSFVFIALVRRKREEYPDWWFDEEDE